MAHNQPILQRATDILNPAVPVNEEDDDDCIDRGCPGEEGADFTISFANSLLMKVIALGSTL